MAAGSLNPAHSVDGSRKAEEIVVGNVEFLQVDQI